MNWIKKIKQFGDNIKSNIKKKFPSREEIESSKWKAKNCCNSGPILEEELKENFYQCKNCNTTYPVKPSERFSWMFWNNQYEILDHPIINDPDTLEWQDASGKYIDKLNKTRKKTGLNSALVAAYGNLTDKLKAVVIASDYRYFGSSISQDEGECILYACEKSIQENAPLIIFAQGGGMRVNVASTLSLNQMPRSIIGINEVKKKNIPVLVVCDHVVAGGISASYASVSDLMFFESIKTRLMFAGPRVAANASNTTPPPNFCEASWALKNSIGDFLIEHRRDTKDTLVNTLNILLKIDTSVSSVSTNETTESNLTAREVS